MAVILIYLFFCTLVAGGQIKVSYFQTVDTLAVNFHEEMDGGVMATTMQIVLPAFTNFSSCENTRVLLLSEGKPIIIDNNVVSCGRCNNDNSNMCIRGRLLDEIVATADANDIRVQVRSDKRPLISIIFRSVTF